MEDFTIWALLTDIAIISALLLVGTAIRAKVKWVQSLFLPASMIAGFIGLALGPSGVNILPFSSQFAAYPGLLIAFIFGAVPIGAAKVRFGEVFQRVREMLSYSILITVIMWGGGALVGLLLVGLFFTDINVGFGLVLGAGFVGGHGTAAAIGEAYAKYGWDDAMSLAMTSATIGILVAVIGGIIIIKRNTEKGNTQFISSFKELPNELRTGLIKEEDGRRPIGVETVSSNSIDPLVYHVAIISMVVGGAYWLTDTLEAVFPMVAIPLFSVAFIVGLIFQNIMRLFKADKYIDQPTMDKIGGSATDFLVAIGIASINLTVVMDYAVPLIILFIFGILWAYVIFKFIGPNMFEHYWFEKAIFGWGWSTGTVAMGLALLRIVDPNLKSRTMEDYAMAYVGLVPLELVIITFAPMVFALGFACTVPTVLLAIAAIVIGLHVHFKLWGFDRSK